MGKNTDKLYVTHSEHTGVYGGHHTASSSGYVQYVPSECIEGSALTWFSTGSQTLGPHRLVSLLTAALFHSNRLNTLYAQGTTTVPELFLISSTSSLGSSAFWNPSFDTYDAILMLFRDIGNTITRTP